MATITIVYFSTLLLIIPSLIIIFIYSHQLRGDNHDVTGESVVHELMLEKVMVVSLYD